MFLDSTFLILHMHGFSLSNTRQGKSSQPRCGQESVSQSVLVLSPTWGPRPDFRWCQTVAVLWMWGALSEKRVDLSFTAVKISSTCHLYSQFYMSAFYIVICQESSSLWISSIYSFTCNYNICMNNIYKASVSLGQSVGWLVTWLNCCWLCQHSHSWLQSPWDPWLWIFFYPRHIHVSKWGLLFD
jgi:hypothetical protein